MKKKILTAMLAFGVAAMAVTGCTIGGVDVDGVMDGDLNDILSNIDENVMDGDGMVNPDAEPTTVTLVPMNGGNDGDGYYESLYTDVLDKMYNVVINPSEAEFDSEDGTMGVWETANFSSNAKAEIGYTFMDLNGDGNSELVIGRTEDNGDPEKPGNEVYAVYMILNGKAECVISGWVRNFHQMTNDGRFVYFASGGAFDYGYGIKTVTADGAVISDLVYAGLAPNGEDMAVYSNPDGIWDLNDNYLTDMTVDEMEENYKKLAKDTQFVYYTPFEFYGVSSQEAGSSPIYPVALSEGKADSAAFEFVLSDADYAVDANVFANSDVTDFAIYKVTEYDGTAFTAEKYREYGSLKYGEELNLVLTLPEVMPEYVIGYVDAEGQSRFFAIECSGYDGSLFLTELEAK